MSDKTLINKSALVVLKVFEAMKGKSLKGCSNGELALAVNDSPANVTRALNTLIQAGFVEKWDDGLFRYSSLMLEIAHAHDIEVKESVDRSIDRRNRVIAGARALING